MENNFKIYNVLEAPFSIHGLYNPSEENGFIRMPEEIADKMTAQMAKDQELYKNTAGARVRFKTDANKIYIQAKIDAAGYSANGNTLLRRNFDLYKDFGRSSVFETNFPSWEKEAQDGDLRMTRDLTGEGMREYTLYFPCYGNVYSLQLGFPEEAKVEAPRDYSIKKPIVFLGSSITQGGCASRPGLQYEGFVSRRLDADFINLGFSGSCRAEKEIMEYIATLPMSAFVYDYDHNAPSFEHLKETHFRGYEIIRKANPDIPIVMMSKPDIKLSDEESILRRIHIQKNYHRGIENGDKNLYYIDGYSLFEGEEREECTVDGCHPNDVGMKRMAGAVTNLLQFVLNK